MTRFQKLSNKKKNKKHCVRKTTKPIWTWFKKNTTSNILQRDKSKKSEYAELRSTSTAEEIKLMEKVVEKTNQSAKEIKEMLCVLEMISWKPSRNVIEIIWSR